MIHRYHPLLLCSCPAYVLSAASANDQIDMRSVFHLWLGREQRVHLKTFLAALPRPVRHASQILRFLNLS